MAQSHGKHDISYKEPMEELPFPRTWVVSNSSTIQLPVDLRFDLMAGLPCSIMDHPRNRADARSTLRCLLAEEVEADGWLTKVL